MGETDPRVIEEMLDAGMVASGYRATDFNRDRVRRAILAALDAARPVEPMPEHDATDAIDRAIRNWSTISDEPPADEEVAGLVERLRSLADLDARSGEPLGKCMREAAATIERQQADVADLRAKLAKAVEALEPFAEEAAHWEEHDPGEQLVEQFDDYEGELQVGDLRRARTALDAIKEDRT